LLVTPIALICTFAFADGGKEIAKHVAALARTLKVNKGAAPWRR